MKSTNGSTRLEIIIVLLVLGLIMCLFFPATGPKIETAKRAQAQNDVDQIARSAAAYQTEYEHPLGTNLSTVSGNILAALLGNNPTLNPRDLVFFEVRPAAKNHSGITNGTFVDPWGGPYYIAFATGTNKTVLAGPDRVAVKKQVAVWSDPTHDADASSLSAATKKRRSVTSWE